jgi:hypothetical protein
MSIAARLVALATILGVGVGAVTVLGAVAASLAGGDAGSHPPWRRTRSADHSDGSLRRFGLQDGPLHAKPTPHRRPPPDARCRAGPTRAIPAAAAETRGPLVRPRHIAAGASAPPGAGLAASGGRFVESNRAGVEALTGGVRPGARRDAEATSGVLHRLARGHGPPTAAERVTPVIGEDDAVGIVGVTTDAQMAEVV